MIYSIINQNNIKKYILDSLEDLEFLSTSIVEVGSIAFIVEDGRKYIFNNKKQWIVLK